MSVGNLKHLGTDLMVPMMIHSSDISNTPSSFKDGNITFLVHHGDVHDGGHNGYIKVDMLYIGRRRTLLHSSILLLSRLGILLYPLCPARHTQPRSLLTIISLRDIKCKDFDALLSILYPE